MIACIPEPLHISEKVTNLAQTQSREHPIVLLQDTAYPLQRWPDSASHTPAGPGWQLLGHQLGFPRLQRQHQDHPLGFGLTPRLPFQAAHSQLECQRTTARSREHAVPQTVSNCIGDVWPTSSGGLGSKLDGPKGLDPPAKGYVPIAAFVFATSFPVFIFQRIVFGSHRKRKHTNCKLYTGVDTHYLLVLCESSLLSQLASFDLAIKNTQLTNTTSKVRQCVKMLHGVPCYPKSFFIIANTDSALDLWWTTSFMDNQVW